MLVYRKLTDVELVELLHEQDHKAYAEIYERYWAMLLHHAIKMLQDEQAAKDVVQDVFTMLWIKSADLELKNSLSAFLYTSVRYRIFDLIDHSKVRQKYMERFARYLDQGRPTTDELLMEKELARRFEAGLEELPKKMREIFELSRIAELNYREIAEKLQVTDHTVKKQMSNALKLMRIKLGLVVLAVVLTVWGMMS